MEEYPQGGAGGVPLDDDEHSPAKPAVKSVKGGRTVAEQKTGAPDPAPGHAERTQEEHAGPADKEAAE